MSIKTDEIKAYVFDLDGTLADTLESMAVSLNSVIVAMGMNALPTDNFRYYAGDGARTLVERALKDAGDEALVHADEVYEAYKKIFDKDCTYKVTAFKGIWETLLQLKGRKIKLAVLSNKPHAQTVKVIEKLFGRNLFDWIQGQQEGVEKKPDPSGALAIADAFGLKPSECMYIGDTNVDMKTGRRAGMFTVGVLWGFRTMEELVENGAQALAEVPGDLLDLHIYIAK